MAGGALDPRMTMEEIIRVIRSEGRSARNVVSWSVPPPVNDDDDDEGWWTTVLTRRGKNHNKGNNGGDAHAGPRPSRRGRRAKSDGGPASHAQTIPLKGGGGTAPRSASVESEAHAATTSTPTRLGGKRETRETAQSRLWSYLLSSLIRATDEVYSVCEQEENELQCCEVIGLLETALADFRELISRFELHSQFEATKPQALAWSVRKISPMHTARVNAGSPARGPLSGTPFGTPSYADRVKGARRATRKEVSSETVGSSGDAATEKGGAGPSSTNPIALAPSDGKPVGGGNNEEAGDVSDPDEDVPENKGGVDISSHDNVASVNSGVGMDDVATPTTPTVPTPSSPNPPPSDPASDPYDSAASPDLRDDYRGSVRCGVPAGVLWSDLANDAGWSSEDGSDDERGPISAASPGSTVLLHHRLSSPSRKRTNEENVRISEEKQARATEIRARQQEELADRLRREQSKVEAARERREIEEFRKVEDMILKGHRAEENKIAQLDVVRKKGKEEDLKIEEIAFITRLEEENKKREVLDRLNESQERLQELEGERQRKMLEKAAREEAAASRRRALEEEREARLREQEARRAARERKIEEDKRLQAAERERAAAQREQARAGRREEMVLAQSAGRTELAERLEAKLSSAERRKSSLMEERLERMGPRPVSRTSSPQGSPQRRGRSSDSIGDGTDGNCSSPLHDPHHRERSLSGAFTWSPRTADELLPAAVEPPPPPVRNAKSLKKRIKRIRQRMAERSSSRSAAVVNGAARTAHGNDAVTAPPATPSVGVVVVNSADPAAGPAFEATGPVLGKLLRRVHAWSVAASSAQAPPDAAAFEALVASLQKVLREKGARLTPAELVGVIRLMIDVCAARFGPNGGGDGLPPKSIGAAFAVIETAIGVGRGGSGSAGGGAGAGGRIGSVIDAIYGALCDGDCPLKLIDVFMRVVPDVYAAPPLASPGGVTVSAIRDPRTAARVTKVLSKTLFSLFGTSSSGNSNLGQPASPQRAPTSATAPRADAVISSGPSDTERREQVTDDIVQYCSAVGWFEVVTQLMFRVPRSLIESGSCVSEVVVDCLDAVLLFCSFDPRRRRPAHDELLDVLHRSHLAGIVSPLLTQVVPQKRVDIDVHPPDQATESSAILLLGIKILNRLAVLDLEALQATLCEEEWLSTALCYVLVRLLTNFSDCQSKLGMALLHEAIYFVGKFAVGNPRGQQMLANHGGFSTILPILCKLPFKYFSVEDDMEILFPTLLSVCYGSRHNASVLQRELNTSSIVEYIDRKLFEASKSDDRFACCNRFPTAELKNAREFFATIDASSTTQSV